MHTHTQTRINKYLELSGARSIELIECLLSMHSALGLVALLHKLGPVYNPTTQEMEKKNLEFKTIFGYAVSSRQLGILESSLAFRCCKPTQLGRGVQKNYRVLNLSPKSHLLLKLMWFFFPKCCLEHIFSTWQKATVKNLITGNLVDNYRKSITT